MKNEKKLYWSLIYIVLFGCSFGAGSWNDLSEEVKIAKQRKDAKIIFSTKEKFNQEIINNKEINLSKPILNKNWLEQNFSSNNFVPHLSYYNKRNLIFKTKKLGKNNFNIKNTDFEPITENNIIFFYDPTGNIFSYSIKRNKIIWEYNFYKKMYKSTPKEINLSISKNNLIISDNLGYVYSLNKKTGKINWAKNYGVPFKSNIKIDGDNVFLLNQDNKFYIISETNGKQKLDLETFPSFLKTNSKTNISLDTNKKNVYFITSAGEIYSLNYKNRNINWLFSLTAINTDQPVDLFFSSAAVNQNNEIVLSSALSTFSMNSTNGSLNWEIAIPSNISPILLDNNIILSSRKGFVLNTDRKTGKVLWSRNIFNKLKKLNYQSTGDITSILLLSNSIFLTTEKGYFIFLDYQNGKILNFTKVAKAFFSKPIVIDSKIIVIDNKMRILQFN